MWKFQQVQYAKNITPACPTKKIDIIWRPLQNLAQSDSTSIKFIFTGCPSLAPFTKYMHVLFFQPRAITASAAVVAPSCHPYPPSAEAASPVAAAPQRPLPPGEIS